MNIPWVVEKLQTMTQTELAKELNCTQSSVRWVIERYFTEEQKALVSYGRRSKKRSSGRILVKEK